jgi:hypothetical protein
MSFQAFMEVVYYKGWARGPSLGSPERHLGVMGLVSPTNLGIVHLGWWFALPSTRLQLHSVGHHLSPPRAIKVSKVICSPE